MIVQSNIKRYYISKVPLQYLIAAPKAVSVGHGDGVALVRAWLPSSRPKHQQEINRRHRMMPIHVEKLPLQPALTFQMHGRRSSILPRLDGADVMVDCRNVKNARY